MLIFGGLTERLSELLHTSRIDVAVEVLFLMTEIGKLSLEGAANFLLESGFAWYLSSALRCDKKMGNAILATNRILKLYCNSKQSLQSVAFELNMTNCIPLLSKLTGHSDDKVRETAEEVM